MKKTQAKILILDDQEDILLSAKMVLKKYFEEIFTVNNPKLLLQKLSEHKVDVVLMDMNYRIGFEDGREGIYMLKEIRKFSPETVVILMTAFGKVETAVESLKLGAFDYILKPWDNEKLIDVVKSGVDFSRKNKKPVEKNKEINPYFIGNSLKVQKAYALAEKVAKTQANVLILGENGTGKFVLAHHIHQHSDRKNQPFVHVDLGSLHDSIFESELFGYAKGAFTDAKADTPGRLEMAQNGTVFLDEIGNVSLTLQAKLLQAIQHKSVTRLGESKERKLDVRIITATNINIKNEVAQKLFREDLYYRINTVEITLPPLREIPEDKVDLAHFLLDKMGHKYQREDVVFDEFAMRQIENHVWNGNIREMENRIERAVILCENSTITASDLDLDDVEVFEIQNTDAQLADVEKFTIERVLIKHNFNISKSAEELGLSRAALYRRMEKFDLDPPK